MMERLNGSSYSTDLSLIHIYATMRRRGLDPQDLYLSLQLEPDKSVVFGSPWTLSLIHI